MPFDFKKYDAKCATLDAAALQREWEHYTRLISGAATSTAVSSLAIPFTFGVSTIGVGFAAPAIHNARKKREIIERHLQSHGSTHHTRKRDVIAAGAISGTVGVVTLGLAPVGADAICNTAAEHGIAYIAENELGVKIVTHLALDAAAVAAEETHMHSKKEQEAWRAYAQAVKEGHNPPLPNSDKKSFVTTQQQAAEFEAYRQYTTTQATPSIQVVPPSDPKAYAETAHMYFPPPLGQARSEASRPFVRRHSTSALSFNAPQSPKESSQLQSNSHLMFGTTTAISAPLTGGQSYGIQLADQYPTQSDRPSSAMGNEIPPVGSMAYTSETHYTPQQSLVLPPPKPPRVVHSEDTIVHQLQALAIRPRTYSMASFDRPPSYETLQQTQFQNGTAQPNYPPHPLSSTPGSPLSQQHTPTTTASDYFTASVSNDSSMFIHSSEKGQYASSVSQSSWSPHDNSRSHSHSPQQQQQNFHAPAQMVYLPQEIIHHASDQKYPHVHQYELSDPTTTTRQLDSSVSMYNNTPTYYTDPWPNQSYSLQHTAAQQVPYFPPPPPAY